MNQSAVFHQTFSPWLSIGSDRRVEVRIRTGLDIKSVELIYGDPHQGALSSDGWSWTGQTLKMELTGHNALHQYFTVSLSAPQHRLKYAFKLSADETFYFGDQRFMHEMNPTDIWSFFFLPYVHSSERFKSPAWVKDTIWYQVFPDRYHAFPEVTLWPDTAVNNQDHAGGNLAGIKKKLPYLADLGITGLYMTPIFLSPTVHKYDTTDYFKIDPHFGTEQDLIDLVKEAHHLGIKVMLDAVFNHAGLAFKPWIEAQKKDSPYREWFHFTQDAYETFSFAKNMPKLNTEHPEVIDYFCKVGTYWIEKADIDGWRLDVANEVSPLFWRTFRSRTKALKPELYILGEIWHDANPWLKGDMMDGVMNYPLTQLAQRFFIDQNILLAQFVEDIQTYRNRYPFEVSLSQFNLYDSHDTVRLMTMAKGDQTRVRLALSFLLFSFGSPCIYYGTEFGQEGLYDPDNRRRMQFPDQYETHPLYQWLKELIQVRKSLPELKAFKDWEIGYDGILLWIEWSGILIWFNPSDQAQSNHLGQVFKAYEVKVNP